MNDSKQNGAVAPQTPAADPGADLNRRPGRREWLGQVDFWEGVKEFILRRIPPGSRPIDQLY